MHNPRASGDRAQREKRQRVRKATQKPDFGGGMKGRYIQDAGFGVKGSQMPYSCGAR